MTSTAQRKLAEFAASHPGVAIPEAARNIARVSLLDTLAVSFAGGREPVIAAAYAYARGLRDPSGLRSWLSGDRFIAEAAALLNAVAAHALDYDDVTPAWRGHPGAVIWPALCASARGRDASLATLQDAFVIGVEAGAQIGSALAAHHYPSGWHATATIGVIAATVACCRLQGLDTERTFNAIGLAAAQSAGMQANFGSMAKPLQAGFAASAAVRAAALAAAGVASGDVLEGPNGFCKLYGDRATLPLDLPGLGGTLAIVHAGIEVKQFPNCYATHRAVEAALTLRSGLGDRWLQVVALEIEGTLGAHQPLLSRLPTSVDEARFSAEFGVASALLDGEVRLSSFTEAALRRKDAVHLMSVARVMETKELGAQRSARVTVRLRDGQQLQRTVVNLPSTFGAPDFMRRLQDKVTDCLAAAGLAAYAPALWDAAQADPGRVPESWSVLQRIWQMPIQTIGRETV